ncbi:outer membrane protein assembly factor BamB [Pseudomonadota bacterium]
MKSIGYLASALLALSLAGCAAVEKLSGKERIEDAPPMKLGDIEQSVQVVQKWSYSAGSTPPPGSIQLVPAIAGGVLFVAGPDGTVSAVEPDSGKSIWRTRLDHRISGAVGAGDEVVLVGTPEGVVVALDSLTGDESWTRRLSSEILAPPAAGLGISVVRTIDGHVYGLSSENGDQQWVFHRQVPPLTLRGNSAPLIIQGLVVAGFANGKMVAADILNGTVLWDINVAEPSGRNEVERMVDIDATPVLVGSVLYVSAFQGAVTALALGSRRKLWSQDISSYTYVGADDENVYISNDEGVVLALDRLTGNTVWEQSGLLRRKLSGPVVLGDHVLVSDFEGYVHVLRKSDGKIVGRKKLAKGGLAGTPVVYQGAIYSMNKQGSLIALTVSEG